MAVQPLKIGKVFFDQNEVNKSTPPTKKIKKSDTIVNSNIYGEEVVDNGNLKVEYLMNTIMNKIDGMGYTEKIANNIAPIDIDIKREIAIGKVDQNAVKSIEIKGKVNNKVEKLKALRRKNGS